MNKKRIAIILLFFIGIFGGLFFYLTNDSYSIPILMYHYITDKYSDDPMTVSKDNFDKQIKYLKDNNYKVLTLDEVENYKHKGKKFPRKSVAITFDDGYDDIYTNAFPILKKYGIKGTVFVITNNIDIPSYLNRRQINEMDKDGTISPESHTVNHRHLNELNYDEQFKELNASKKRLEEITSHKVDYAAYPYGDSNRDTIEAAKKSGYKLGFRVDSDYTRVFDDDYSLARFWILNDFDYFTKVTKVSRISDFKKYFRKPRPSGHDGPHLEDKSEI